MAKTPDLRSAIMDRAAGRPAMPTPEPAPRRANRQPSRIGKVNISAHFSEPARDQFKQLAIQRRTTVQGLLGEAINDIFAKYGLPEIVDPE